MQMPINPSSVLEAVTNASQAATMPISASVWIDESAPSELIAHVRAVFASGSYNAKVTIAYLAKDVQVGVNATDDVAVIVAGLSDDIGSQAAYIRSLGVPVMVVTTLPNLVSDLAAAGGHPIPKGDLVYPSKINTMLDTIKGMLPLRHTASSESNYSDTPNYIAVDDSDKASVSDNVQEPIILNEETSALLDIRMGKWIITTCKSSKLAFALAFPFIRRPLSIDAIEATSIQNAAIGFAPIIPGADMPLMTLNQVKMLLQIAIAYGEPLTTERIKELAALLGGAYFCRQAVRSITKVVPFAGWIVSGIVGYTATSAFGYAAIEYFEAGGDIKGLASVIDSAREEGMKLASSALQSPAGQVITDRVKTAVKSALQSKSS